MLLLGILLRHLIDIDCLSWGIIFWARMCQLGCLGCSVVNMVMRLLTAWCKCASVAGKSTNLMLRHNAGSGRLGRYALELPSKRTFLTRVSKQRAAKGA